MRGWGRDGLGTGARGRGARARRALMSTRRGLLHHSDGGSQYASADYRRALRGARDRLQHEPARQLLDNAVAESFFATLGWSVQYRPWCRARNAACCTAPHGVICRRCPASRLLSLLPNSYRCVMTESPRADKLGRVAHVASTRFHPDRAGGSGPRGHHNVPVAEQGESTMRSGQQRCRTSNGHTGPSPASSPPSSSGWARPRVWEPRLRSAAPGATS